MLKENRSFDKQVRNLTFRGLVTCELFVRKDFSSINGSLKKISDELHSRSYSLKINQRECEQFIQKATNSLHSVGWHSSLFLTADRGRPGAFFSENLPDSVSLLSLSIHNVLPSIMAVVAFCKFKTRLSEQLKHILLHDYKEERIKVGNQDQEAYSIISPDQIKREKVQQGIFQVRKSVEEFISRYFHGIFLSSDCCTEVPVCPSIELFSLREFPLENGQTITAWVEKRNNWIFLDTLGCLPYEIHKEAGYLLMLPEWKYHGLTLKILGSMKYFASDNYKNQGFPEAETAFFYGHDHLLKELITWVSLIRLIDLKRRGIVTLREESRKELSSVLKIKNLSKLTRLFSKEIMEKYVSFTEKRLWFQRFQSELKEELGSIANALVFSQKFVKIYSHAQNKDQQYFWFDDLSVWLKNSATSLWNEMEFLKEEFNTRLSVVRIQSNNVYSSATKRWNVTLIMLTLVLLFLTVLTNWNILTSWGKRIWEFIEPYFS